MSVVERETVREVAPVTTADVLNRAADLLEEFGWCQFHPADDGTHNNPVNVLAPNAVRFCLLGAVGRASWDLGRPIGEKLGPDKLWSQFPIFEVREFAANCGLPFDDWNDMPRRTKEEVVAKLREAARNA